MSKTFFLFGTGPLIAALCLPAVAQTSAPKRMADHPAVAVQRLKARQGYDHASKFYPHPAWLYLRSTPDEAGFAARPATAPATPPGAESPQAATALARVDVE